LTTVETSTTSLSTISLNLFGLKAYNFEVVRKYNIMESFVTNIKLTSLKCKCGEAVDAWGQHAFVYKHASGRTQRHHALNDIVARSFASAGIPVSKEPSGVYRDNVRIKRH